MRLLLPIATVVRSDNPHYRNVSSVGESSAFLP